MKRLNGRGGDGVIQRASVIQRLQGAVVMARPPVFLLLALYAELGLTETGRPNACVPLLKILGIIAAFLIFSVACNDLADEAIDRVNLPGDPRRPLVTGAVSRAQMRVTGCFAAGVALAISAFIGWPALAITAAGLSVSGAYSVRPVRIAERGVLAPLLLPACYVAVPYLLGVTTAQHAPTGKDLALLAGLYLGFIGRILLKDFRDVRGDAMFGKRTFLVRYGRRWTCVFSACFWAAGTAVILIAMPDRSELIHIEPYSLGAPFALAGCAVFAILLIGGLIADDDPRRDERLISAIAIVGRGMILLLILDLSLPTIYATTSFSLVLSDLLGVAILLQAISMARHGPRLRYLPQEMERLEADSLVS